MSTVTIIVIMAIVTMIMKSTGPAIVGGVEPPPVVDRVISLFTPALIAALVATSTFSQGRTLIADERVLGVGVGLIALHLRAPILIAGILAAGTCAVARQFT